MNDLLIEWFADVRMLQVDFLGLTIEWLLQN